MPETLRFKPRLPMVKVEPAPRTDLSPLQWQGSAFLEGMRVAVERTQTSAECHALYAVLAEAEEKIAAIATACMARENCLQMRGK
jgi:hypothetical protein